MKRFYFSFCLIAASLLLFTKCKKDDNPVTPAATNYSPLTAGSSWTYNYTQIPNPAVPYTLTVTGTDTTINTKSYKILTSSDGSGNKYMAKIDSNYYRFASYPVIGSFEELYLKDNRDVNSTWTGSIPFSYPGVPVQLVANLTYTVKEKGIALTVNNKSYADVVHIRLDINVGAFGNVGGGDFYYAKDIGLIQNVNSLSVQALNFSFKSNTDLTAYQIK